MADFQDAAQQIIAAADAKNPEDNLRLLLAAALVGAPTQTERQDGSTAQSEVSASAEGILTGLAFGTVARQELQTRVGGNPSSTKAATFRDRLDAPTRARLLDLATELGVTNGAELIDSWLAELEAAPRINPDPAARTLAATLGAPTGDLKQPTLVVHTGADPVAIVENASYFAERTAERGKQDLLRTVIIQPPATYSSETSTDAAADLDGSTSLAPYGAGHCRFTDAQRIGAVTALDTWVQTATPPTNRALADLLRPGAAVDPELRPWPTALSP